MLCFTLKCEFFVHTGPLSTSKCKHYPIIFMIFGALLVTVSGIIVPERLLSVFSTGSEFRNTALITYLNHEAPDPNRTNHSDHCLGFFTRPYAIYQSVKVAAFSTLFAIDIES